MTSLSGGPRMNWNESADTYLRLPDDRYEIVFPTLLGVVGDTRPCNIADVGGGDGRFLELLVGRSGRKRFDRLALTDPAESMRSKARERLAKVDDVEVVAAPAALEQGAWDVATLIAVWMAVRTDAGCIDLLRGIRGLLKDSGRLVAAVTHPCFRDRPFHSYRAEFGPRDYFRSGAEFTVHLGHPGASLDIRDTHWTLSDHVRQLREAGFTLADLVELPDLDPNAGGSSWMIVVAQPDRRG